MKTILACIILCLVALFFGKRQQTRITDLVQRIATVDAPVRMESRRNASVRDVSYRSKYRHREATLTAPVVFETILNHLQSRGVQGSSNGPDVVMENREAFQAMLKLDLAGQKELIRLIATSDDPRLGADRDLSKVEQISVCLCAMADRNPETALEYLRNSDEKIGKFYQNWFGPDRMIYYAIRRLCERDPAAGLNELVAEAGKDGDKEYAAHHTAKILVDVAEHEPEMALETIPRLPDELRPEALKSVLTKADTFDERTRYFQIIRNGLRGDRKSLEMAFRMLLHSNMNEAEQRSWKDRAEWLEGLNLTDDEKIAYSACEYRDIISDSPDVAQWLADYLPPSKERDFVVWTKIQRLWTDAQAAKAFLREHSIDEEEMKRLASDGFLRPN